MVCSSATCPKVRFPRPSSSGAADESCSGSTDSTLWLFHTPGLTSLAAGTLMNAGIPREVPAPSQVNCRASPARSVPVGVRVAHLQRRRTDFKRPSGESARPSDAPLHPLLACRRLVRSSYPKPSAHRQTLRDSLQALRSQYRCLTCPIGFSASRCPKDFIAVTPSCPAGLCSTCVLRVNYVKQGEGGPF